MYKIVLTSNYDLDLYDEKFVENIPRVDNRRHAVEIARSLNRCMPISGPDYYKVVEEGYVLRTSDPNK